MRSLLSISQQFIIDEDNLLGKGSTGNVYFGFEASNLNKKYAVKAIDLSKITNPVTQYLLSCQIVALTDLSKQNCKHIVKLQSQPIFHRQFIYLVMELLEGGSLADVIRQNCNGIQQTQTFKIFVQIIKAYRVIQQLGIVHRDIKPDNLIFRKKNQLNHLVIPDNELCFIDFGYCLKQSVPNKPEGYYNVGSPKYMSPQAYKQSQYSQKSDIWAMGVILYEMLHGTTIDAGMNMEQYFDKMQHEGLVNRKGINRQIWQLLVGMLQFEVQRRMELQEIERKIDWILNGGNIQNGIKPVVISQVPTHIHVKSSQIISTSFNQKHQKRVQTFNSSQGQNIPQIRFHSPQHSHSYNQFRPVNPNSQRQMINNNYAVSLSHQQNQNPHLSNSHIIQPNETIIPQKITFPSYNSNLKSVQIKSPLHISEKFLIDEDQLLGKGSTGNVYLGFQTQNFEKKYAVKAIDLSQVTNPVTQYLLSCEIVALKDLAEKNCKHIVKLEDILFDQKYCYLVMQLLEGGSLADYIRYRSNGIDENQALNLFKQMFEAYGVIRSLQIIHRDIKPDNLIFRRPKLQNNQTKIENQLCFIDFGYCLKQSVPNKPEGYYNVGSPKYMSPQAYKQSQYSQKSDIWAMGVILYEMLHGTTIDAGMNMEQYFDKMQHEGLVNRKGINRQIWELLNNMLRFRVQDRQQYDEIRTLLQNIVIPLRDSMIVPSFQNNEHKLNKSQLFVNQHFQPIQSLQQHQFLNNQSQQFNKMVPELKFKTIENPNLNMRHSQRSSTQPPNLFQRQLQPKSFTKSYIFPQHNNNSQFLRRNPSAQIIHQQVIIHQIPQKNYSLQNIVHPSHLKNQFKSSPLQKIEQERLNQNNLKRSMINKQNSIQKLRKINFNGNYPQNINYERTKFFEQGHNLNSSLASHHPGQYPIKNPYIKQLTHNIPVQRNDGFRQSVGVIRSENIIREQRVKDQQNELTNKEVRRQMSLKKLNQMQNNNMNTNQNIFTPIKPFQDQNNLRATISNNIPSNFHKNIISVQNVYQPQNQNKFNDNINILRDPSKIMQNENQDIHQRSFNTNIHQGSFIMNIHQRSFDMNNTKTAQKYFNNYPNTTDNIYSHFNQKHSPLLMTNLPSHFVQHNPSSIGNNVPLNLHPINSNINANTPEKLVINYGSQSIVRFPSQQNSQVKQVINVPTNMMESRFADPRNSNQIHRSQFEINSVQQSAQKVAHNTYFQMNKMDVNTISNEKDPKGNYRYHQSTVQPKIQRNHNVYLKKQLFHSQMNNNLNQSKIINPNETVSRFQHINEAVSRFQPPKQYSQAINVYSRLNVQNNLNQPFPVDPYKSHNIIENKNNHQMITSNVQNSNQPSNHYVSNNLQGQKLQPKIDSNFSPPNNYSQYNQKFVQKSFPPHQNLPFRIQNQHQIVNNSVPQEKLRRIPFTNNAQMLNKNVAIYQSMNVKNGQILSSPVQVSSVPLSTSKIVTKELPHFITQTRKIIRHFPNSQTVPMGRNIEGPLRRQVYNGDNRNNVQYFQVPTRDTNMLLMPNQNPNIRFQ